MAAVGRRVIWHVLIRGNKVTVPWGDFINQNKHDLLAVVLAEHVARAGHNSVHKLCPISRCMTLNVIDTFP